MTTESDDQIEYDSWAIALGWEDDYDDDSWADLDDEIEGHPTCVMCGTELDWADLSVICEDCEAEQDAHANRRDAKRARESGMVVSNRSIKSVIVPVIEKRGREARRKETRRAS